MPPRLLRLLALLPAFCVLTYVWVAVALTGGGILDPQFIENPDALVRLERIYQLMTDGGWFERVLARVGATDHLVLHWTRPLDSAVVPVAWLLSLFTPLHTAVLIAGVVISLPAGWLALWFAAKLPAIAGDCRLAIGALGALFVSALPYFNFVYIPAGWPDHHGALVLVFIASLWLGHRMVFTEQPAAHQAWLLGTVQALGVWISPESLVFIATLHAGLGLAWVFGLHAAVARQALHAAIALCVAVAVALVIEYGADIPTIALDRLSLFSFAPAGALVALWAAAYLVQGRVTAPLFRALLGTGVAVVALLLILAIAPQAVHGPMADADAWFVNVWTGTFRDGFNLSAKGGLMLCAIALAMGVWLCRSGRVQLWALAYLAPTLIIFAVLSVASSMRWVVYGEICATPLILAGFGRIWDALSGREGVIWTASRAAAVTSVMALPVADLALAREDGIVFDSLPVADAAILRHDSTAFMAPTAPPQERLAAQACDRNELIDALNTIELHTGPLLVMAHANLSPTILFFTQHRVQSVPIHPDAEAVHESARVFLATRDEHPPTGVADILAICPVGHEFIAYQGTPDTLHARLSRGDTIAGFSPITGVGGGFKLFWVTR